MGGINMLLSYLNKQVLMSELDIKNNVQELVTPRKTANNIDLAPLLEQARCELIQCFIAIPVTAAWLVHKYQSSQDAEQSFVQALDNALKNLKKHDLIASLALGDNERFAEDNVEKRDFVAAFSEFPFTFDDLLELTDVVVYSYQCGVIGSSTETKLAGSITKRLAKLTRLKANELALWYKSLSDYPPSSYQAVINTVVAEQQWLKARQQLVEKNARLVSFIANQYKGGFLDFEDLVQEGQTGLLVAVDKFDYRLGCQFSTYAAYWIRQRILRALSKNERVVRLPAEQISAISKLYRLKEQWLAKMGVEPSVAELAVCADKSIQEVDTLLSLSQTSVALENFDEDDESAAPIDVLEQQIFEPCFDQMAEAELETWLASALKTLSPREAKVISCHFGLDSDQEMTLQEIGTELNISRERVRQIQASAFDKMKLSYGEQLISFL